MTKELTDKSQQKLREALALANFNSGGITLLGTMSEENGNKNMHALVILPKHFDHRYEVLESLISLGVKPAHCAVEEGLHLKEKHHNFNLLDYECHTGDEPRKDPADPKIENILTINLEGVQILIKKGVKHPVLDAIAEAYNLERPRFAGKA